MRRKKSLDQLSIFDIPSVGPEPTTKNPPPEKPDRFGAMVEAAGELPSTVLAESDFEPEPEVDCPCCAAGLPCEVGPSGGRACVCCMGTGKVPESHAKGMIDAMDPRDRAKLEAEPDCWACKEGLPMREGAACGAARAKFEAEPDPEPESPPPEPEKRPRRRRRSKKASKPVEPTEARVEPIPSPHAPDLDDAAIIHGGMAQRILSGECREDVIAERRAEIAAERKQPGRHKGFFVNIGEEPLRFKSGNMTCSVGRHDSIWLRPEAHEALDDEVRRVLVPSLFALRLVLDGKVKSTRPMIAAFISAGLLDARSTVHELRPTPAFDDAVEF